MKRRDFLINTSLAAVSSLELLRCKTAQMTGLENIGLQLYTVRDAMEEDVVGTLTALAKMGYRHVENAGYHEGKYYGHTLQDFKQILNDLGLKMHSGHTQTGATALDQTHTMTNDWELVCEDAVKMNQDYIVLAYLVDEERKSIDDYKKVAELCNECGETANRFGLKLAYHNHDFEFRKIDGQVPYDILLSEVDPNLMDFEIDLYWTRKGGVEALDYFKKYPGRFPLWHVKDMEESEDQFFTEVGNGVINWKKYFHKASEAGMKHFYVEQDHCKNYLPMKSVEISIDYLKRLEI